MGTEFPWRWGRGTISANLDVIWGMSAQGSCKTTRHPLHLAVVPGPYGPGGRSPEGMATCKQPARSSLLPTARCRYIGRHRAAVPGSQRTATCSSRYRAAGSATGGPRGSSDPMGAGIGFSPASTRVAMVAARCRACSTRAPAPSTAGPTTLAPTVALALLSGEYMQRACHGRYDAKARNLRRSLRAAAAFADAVEWRNPRHGTPSSRYALLRAPARHRGVPFRRERIAACRTERAAARLRHRDVHIMSALTIDVD